MKFDHPYYRIRAEKWLAQFQAGKTIREIAQECHYSEGCVSIQIRRLRESLAVEKDRK